MIHAVMRHKSKAIRIPVLVSNLVVSFRYGVVRALSTHSQHCTCRSWQLLDCLGHDCTCVNTACTGTLFAQQAKHLFLEK